VGVKAVPAIAVRAGAIAISSADPNMSFGTTTLHSPVTMRYDIVNTGTGDLILSGFDQNLPAGFTLLTAPDTTVAPGESTYFVIQFKASSVGNYASQWSFGTNIVDPTTLLPVSFALE